MKIIPSAISAILFLFHTINVNAQTSTDKFTGFWSVAKNDEGVLFIITQENGKYKVSVMYPSDTAPSETWTASLISGNLSGTNGSLIKPLSSAQLKLSNYEIEASDETILYKLTQLSTFFGVWKSNPSDEDFIKISLSTGITCGRSSNFNIFHSKDKPDGSINGQQNACGTQDSIKNKDILVKYISNGKVVINWNEEHIYNKTYNRIYPTVTTPAGKYSNLNTFWSDFKKIALQKDYSKLSLLTYFPFLEQGTYMNKDEFTKFTFPDYIIKALKIAKSPVKSKMFFGDGLDTNGNKVTLNFDKSSIYEVTLGGPRIYFSKVNGEFRFIAILYGE